MVGELVWIEVGGVRGWWNETRNEWETKKGAAVRILAN